MTKSVLAVAVVSLALAGCGTATLPAHPSVRGLRPVLTSSADEEGPAPGRGAFAWMQRRVPDRVPRPPFARTNVYLRVGSRTMRVNPVGTYAETGGFDGGALVLQIIGGGRSRLARYDLRRHRLEYLPAWVNDGAWLWKPDADGGRILYGAIVPGHVAMLAYEIRLADLRTRTVRVLARFDGHTEYAAPGQLRGRWATWVGCPENICNVWREDLRAGTPQSAPDPDHLVYTQIGPAVDAHGTVYFDRTLATCGKAQILRWDGRRVARVLSLPSRYAYQYGSVSKDGRTLYVDLGPCSYQGDDIYALSLLVPR